MKKLNILLLAGGMLFGLSACKKAFIELDPLDQFSDVVYFKQPADFKAFTANYYTRLQGWNFNEMDLNTDLSANNKAQGYDLGHGTIAVGGGSWDYSGIRSCNILLKKAGEYTGTGDISQYIGESYFFRAYSYFGLLKTFGGVPIVTTVLETNSPDLYAPRNSRYEVVKLILADLDEAIAKLPSEQSIPAADKGRISKWAAMAFKARVELYEATWEKYLGTSTDGDGTSSGAGSKGYNAADAAKYFADVVALTQDVMNNGGFSLWNQNSKTPANMSYLYLFNLEDAGSNPYGLTKASNNEFILYRIYDYTFRRGGINLSWTSWQLYPSRKFIDMPVCTDGLPAEKSPLFQGYHKIGDEFKNRDLRLLCYVNGSTSIPTNITLEYGSLGFSGYGNSKYAAYNYGTYRKDNEESANYPILRLAEVYLMYAEALYELNGTISDAQLDASINKLRERAGVAKLTNALVTDNGLDMKTEIRRERAVELYREGFRFDDLKRWGILEAALNPSRLGMVVGDGVSYSTDFKDAAGNATAKYKPVSYVLGEEAVQTPAGTLKCVVLDSYINHSVQKKHYLWPVSSDQIRLNSKLLQNPGY